jgi:hypothetical protein
VLGPQGQAILRRDHQPLIDPPQVDHPAKLPVGLRRFCVPLPVISASP